MNTPIIVAIFLIGCLTILAFIALAIYLAFFYEETKTTWTIKKQKMLTDLITAIKKGDIQSLDVIVTLMEADESLTRAQLDLAYQNGRVDVLSSEYKRSYSDWKYPKNTDADIANSQK